MSLITDLLSKVKHEEQRKDIPPGLKDTIIQSVEKDKSRNRMILPILLAVVLLIAGAAAVYYVSSMLAPARPVAVQPVAVQPAPPAPPAAQTSASAEAVREKDQPQADREVSKEPPVQTIKARRSAGRVAKSSGSVPAMHEAARTKESASTTAGERNAGTDFQPLSNKERDELIYAARSHEARRDYQRALAAYKKALAADPNNYILMNNIAGVLIQMEQYAEAVRYGEKATGIRRNHIPSLVNLGIAYNKMGRTTEGESFFQQALSIDPTNRYALLNLGLLNERRGSFDKGIEYYSKLAERSDCQGYLGLARIAEKQGRMASAVNYYRMALGTGNVDAKTKATVNDRLMQITLTP